MECVNQSKKTMLSRIIYTLGVSLLFLLCSRSIQLFFVQEFSAARAVYVYLSRIVSLGVLVYFGFSYKQVPKKLYAFTLLFYAVLFLSTLFGGGNIRRLVSVAYPLLSLNAFVLLQCTTMARMRRFLQALSDFFLVLVGINLFFLMFTPGLFGETATTGGDLFFLGLENQIIYPLTLGLLILLLNNHFNNERAKLQLYIGMYFVTVIANFSVGSFIGAIVLFGYFAFPFIRRFFQRNRFSVLLAIFFVIFILLVFFSKPVLSFPPIRFVIEDILHKDITLTNRTIIWDVALQEIFENPIFGHGFQSSNNLFHIITRFGDPETLSAHNQFLQTWYEGGTAALLAVLGLLLFVDKCLRRCADKVFTRHIKVILIAFMIMFLVESPSFDTLFFTANLGGAITIILSKEKQFMEASQHPIAPLSEERISVVIPVYNVEAYVAECLTSVVNQTYRNLEILVVDDGSTDNSYAICQEFAEKDKRITLIQQENGGLSAARNAAIPLATGKYITFVDSDDFLDADMIRYLYTAMQQHRADMAVCQPEFVDEQGKAIPRGKRYTDAVIDGNHACMRALFSDCGLDTCAWNKLYKTDFFETIRYPEGKYHEDVFTTYQLIALCNRIVIGSQPLYCYRQRAGSIVKSDFSPKHLHAIEASTQRAEFIAEHYPEQLVLAQSYIVFSANTCLLKLIRSENYDADIPAYLQKQYRCYEGAFLRGNSSSGAKLFSLFAWINVNAVLKTSRFLLKLRSRIKK